MLKSIKALMHTVNKLVCVEMELNRLKSDDQSLITCHGVYSRERVPQEHFPSLKALFIQVTYYIRTHRNMKNIKINHGIYFIKKNDKQRKRK